MPRKAAQDLKPGDQLVNLSQTFEVINAETDDNNTVVFVNVIGHAPFAYDYGQKVRTA